MSAGVAHVEVARIADVLTQAPEAPGSWLSASELTRLAELRHPARHRQYLAGHWLARVLLARGYGGVPTDWNLIERRSQPPAVQGHGDAYRVSISHTADWVAAAVADVAIGIDLEQRPRVLDASIEPLMLNADEAPGSLDADALLQRWVAKEAWIKREAGSALAGRLQQLQLQATSRERADVVIDSHEAFYFGLALEHGCRVIWHGERGVGAGVAFLVTDPGAGGGLE